MKILHVIDSLSPDQGGPSVSCPSLAAAQASQGHEVSVVFYADIDELEHVRNIGKQTVSYFELLKLDPLGPRKKISEKLLASKMKDYLHVRQSELDFVHIHGLWRPSLQVAANCCIKLKIPYAVAPRGMLDYWSMEQNRYRKQLFLTLFWRRLLNGARFIHALNKDEQQAIERFGFTTAIRVSPNGVAASKLSEIDQLPADMTCDPKFGTAGGASILFMSRLHHKKGLDYLAESFNKVLFRHPNTRLLVAGPDEGALPDFQSSIAKLGIEDHVDILGAVYGEKKYRLIKSATVFCLPSRQEGFSVMLSEVMACGVPVVISEQCNFPEVAESGAGEVVPLNAQAIADALCHYLENPEQREQASENGPALISSRFTWEGIARQIVEVYA